MIVLQDSSLPTVWEEIEGLQKLEPAPTWTQNWGDRRQRFQWFKKRLKPDHASGQGGRALT